MKLEQQNTANLSYNTLVCYIVVVAFFAICWTLVIRRFGSLSAVVFKIFLNIFLTSLHQIR